MMHEKGDEGETYAEEEKKENGDIEMQAVQGAGYKTSL
jgi:hypothetical protein